MRKFALLSLFSLIFVSLALPKSGWQEWVTPDGQTIKADLIGCYNRIVYLETAKGKTLLYDYLDFNEQGKQRVQEWFSDYASKLLSEPLLVSQSESKLSSFLADDLLTLEEGKLVKYDFSERPEPEFYAFYFSAHWCGPCRKFTPRLVGFYKAMHLLGYENFEIVFVSSDRSSSEMKKYMAEAEMPWPALKYSKRTNKVVSQFRGSGIPCLVVTDREGRLLSHSYVGDEYVGPSSAKDDLSYLLRFTNELKKKVEEEFKGSDSGS